MSAWLLVFWGMVAKGARRLQCSPPFTGDFGHRIWSLCDNLLKNIRINFQFTHLQGVDGTTLAIKPKIILHCVILLSQKLAEFQ
ncbi:hypothetical protein ELI00_05315 [Rhizobium ruizarguesonis]|nr:hypothetical protein ELI00_05315 [Rhizobium ruizarguesonis]